MRTRPDVLDAITDNTQMRETGMRAIPNDDTRSRDGEIKRLHGVVKGLSSEIENLRARVYGHTTEGVKVMYAAEEIDYLRARLSVLEAQNARIREWTQLHEKTNVMFDCGYDAARDWVRECGLASRSNEETASRVRSRFE